VKASKTRKPISKSKRFDIFHRDGFICQYCGKQPPEATLEIDHIQPVSKGGNNDEMNLITACQDCNRGKSAKELGNISQRPDADLEWLSMQQEVAELRRYQLAKKERDLLQANIIDMLQNTWAIQFDDDYVPNDTMFYQWLSFAEPEQIEEAISRASIKSYKLYDFNDRLKYTAGILRNITGTNINA